MIDTARKIWGKIRYGLVLKVLRDRLASAGIEITLYYLTIENHNGNSFSNMQDAFKGYVFEFFGPEEMKVIAAIPGQRRTEEKLLARLRSGNKCFGIKSQGQVVAFNWIDLKENNFEPQKRKLKDNEAYLFDLYTLKPFRGDNVAPYLRYQSYRVLNDMGRDRLYSITELLNKPAIKFKRKLNAQFSALYLYIKLFNRYNWQWKLKDYKIE